MGGNIGAAKSNRAPAKDAEIWQTVSRRGPPRPALGTAKVRASNWPWRPLPPDYSPLAMEAVATSAANTSVSTYGAVLKIGDLKNIPPEQSEPYLFPYRALQEKYNRRSEVRNLLERKLPSLLSQFDRSASAYDTAKSQPEQIPTAALELRNLLDEFKGELIERARRYPKENMNWETMAERLGVIPDPPTGQDSSGTRSLTGPRSSSGYLTSLRGVNPLRCENWKCFGHSFWIICSSSVRA